MSEPQPTGPPTIEIPSVVETGHPRRFNTAPEALNTAIVVADKYGEGHMSSLLKLRGYFDDPRHIVTFVVIEGRQEYRVESPGGRKYSEYSKTSNIKITCSNIDGGPDYGTLIIPSATFISHINTDRPGVTPEMRTAFAARLDAEINQILTSRGAPGNNQQMIDYANEIRDCINEYRGLQAQMTPSFQEVRIALIEPIQREYLRLKAIVDTHVSHRITPDEMSARRRLESRLSELNLNGRMSTNPDKLSDLDFSDIYGLFHAFKDEIQTNARLLNPTPLQDEQQRMTRPSGNRTFVPTDMGGERPLAEYSTPALEALLRKRSTRRDPALSDAISVILASRGETE